ncbi:MAG: VWA domain-containing protein [Acidobacteriales bacterium]|nr:VWA domain-containing protein [Terriglobales bacterium]
MVARSALFLCALVLSAQTSSEPTLRITVNLIQVDAVVTGKQGHSVPDLKKEDFEVLEDGKPRKVEYLSYIAAPVAPVAPPSAAAPTAAPSLAAPREADARRSIAIVVDDFGLSFVSMHFVRDALRKFVDEQMQPGDLVAIIRTRGGMGALEQYTMDKRLLRAAIGRIRYSLDSRGEEADLESQEEGGGARTFRGRSSTFATMLALRRVVDGLKQMPGRKSVLLFSDALRPPDDIHLAAKRLGSLGSLRSLADQANRAAVVFYTVHGRGTETFALKASDNVGPLIQGDNPGGSLAVIQRNRYGLGAQRVADRSGLDYLARETGGVMIAHDNDLSAGASQALKDQSGYYLLGYRPPEDSFVTKDGVSRYHALKVVVKRPGLRVRTRAGYFGVPDSQPAPAEKDRVSRLMAALRSPFAAGEINLHLTGLFGNAADMGSYIHAMLHIDGRGLTFADDGADWKKAEVDLVLMAIGEDGVATEMNARHYQIRVSNREYDRAVKNGFLYRLICPVKKPGAYQVRAAVRDSNSDRMGSASQFVGIPNVASGRMALSGILLESRTQGATGDSALRVFPQGGPLAYGVMVYNPRLAGLRASQITIQAQLFRGGKSVWTAPPAPLGPAPNADLLRVQFAEELDFGTSMPPGEYLLRITAIDKTASKKAPPVTQWTDFELVPAN